MFCVFREICGSKYLCKSVKSVGEYSLPVCSVNSVGVFFSAINFSHAALMRLPQISLNTQNRLAEDILPQIARIHTDIYIT